MQRYTYTVFDWNGERVMLSIVAETRAEGWRMMLGILDNPASREFINIDEGIYLSNVAKYQ